MDPVDFSFEKWNTSNWGDIENLLKKRIPILIHGVDIEEPSLDIFKNKKYISYIDNPEQQKDMNFKYIVSKK